MGARGAQEILRRHNEPSRTAAGEDAPPASLWHAMQQRQQRASSSDSEQGEQGVPAKPSTWLEDGAGSLFDSGSAPFRSAPWQQAHVADVAAVHSPLAQPERQTLAQKLHRGQEDAGASGGAEEALAGKQRHSPGLGPERSEPSNSMMGNLMNTMRRCAKMSRSAQLLSLIDAVLPLLASTVIPHASEAEAAACVQWHHCAWTSSLILAAKPEAYLAR